MSDTPNLVSGDTEAPTGSALVSGTSQTVDHLSASLNALPTQWIDVAKSTLTIAYGHTSHGSQLVTGMQGLVNYAGDQYAFNATGSGGALRLIDTPFSGASDLGNPDRTAHALALLRHLGLERLARQTAVDFRF